MRPKPDAVLGKAGISRFPRKVLPCMLGVSDRAGFGCTSRYRRIRCCLPLPFSVGIPENSCFAAEYPARTFPCQRFVAALASGSA